MPRPHDLIRLTYGYMAPPAAPEWVRQALGTTPCVVVRRAESTPAHIAVGVRGDRRADRYAMTLTAEDIAEVVAPEDLRSATSRGIPAMRTLAGVRTALDRTSLRWGPTGSLGFELATGVPIATDDSDLDLLMRVPLLTPGILACLADLDKLFGQQPARIDCQIETCWGAVALADLLGRQPEILTRTQTGPRLLSRAVALP